MKTVVVTGATSGIGFAVCRAMLEAGFRVIGVGRCAEHCASALQELDPEIIHSVRPTAGNTAGNTARPTAGNSRPEKSREKPHEKPRIAFLHGDLMQQAEVRRIGAEIRELLGKNGGLYALVNNAGCVRSWYMTTDEGYEQQFALNHLAAFLLTRELLPNLLKARGRVLITSSGSHMRMKMRWNDIMFQKRYSPLFAYKQSKLCNLLFAYGLNMRYGDRGLCAHGIDPGLVRTNIGNKNTSRIIDLFWRLRRTGGVAPEIPARIYVEFCASREPKAGLYHGIEGEKRYSREVTEENADRLFELSERLCSITYEGKKQCSS